MKTLLLTFALIASCSLFPANSYAETQTKCEKNVSDEIIINGVTDAQLVTDTSGNFGNSCKEIPDKYKVTFYRLGLCKTDPVLNENRLDDCILFVNSDAGVSHIIEGVGAGSALDIATADPAILPGSYSYIVLVVSNELQIMHTETFGGHLASQSITGATGSGNVCWTIAKKTMYSGHRLVAADLVTPEPGAAKRAQLAMDCGATVGASLDFTSEVFDSLGDGVDPWNGQILDADFSVRLLQSDNLTAATDKDNGSRMLVSFPNESIVTNNSKFNIQFKLTDSVSVDLAPDLGVIYALKNGADPFQVSIVITE